MCQGFRSPSQGLFCDDNWLTAHYMKDYLKQYYVTFLIKTKQNVINESAKMHHPNDVFKTIHFYYNTNILKWSGWILQRNCISHMHNLHVTSYPYTEKSSPKQEKSNMDHSKQQTSEESLVPPTKK